MVKASTLQRSVAAALAIPAAGKSCTIATDVMVLVKSKTQNGVKTMEYEILVIGSVERRVKVKGNSLAEAEANAYSEWSRLTGGHIGTAESVEAIEVETNVCSQP